MSNDNDFFDQSKYTDDQLISRIEKLRSAIGYQYSRGYVTSAESMELILAMLEEEYECRTEKFRALAKAKQQQTSARYKSKHPNDADTVRDTSVINIGRIEGEKD